MVMDALPAARTLQGPPQPDESWDHHYRDERDAAYLYRALAAVEKTPELQAAVRKARGRRGSP